MSRKKITLLVLSAGLGVILVLLLNFNWFSPLKRKTMITIGSKDFTESIVLALMMAEIIEAETGLPVERKVNLGGSNIALKGLFNKEIHIYPEYTGTILFNLYPENISPSGPPLKQIQQALENDLLELTNLFGFNNTYVLAVKKELAKKHNLKTIQDLVKVSHEMVLGCDFEFLDRPDGYHNLCEKCNLRFKKVKGMNRGIMYRSIQQDAVDVIISFTTDGQLQINQLYILDDDQNFFPSYEAGALVHQDILKSFPEIRSALAKLEGQISEEEMRDINVKIEYEGLKTKEIAHDFLKAKGLVN